MAGNPGRKNAFIYSPNGLPIKKVNVGRLSGEKAVAHWYDSRNGAQNRSGNS